MNIYINKYYPVAFLYFFLNGVFLPHGLLYTTLLTPVLLIWLLKFPSFRYIWIFFIVLLPFALIHFRIGVANNMYYLKSATLLFTVYIFCIAFYQYLSECHSIRTIYRKLLSVNILFVGFAIVALFIPSLKLIFWYYNEITQGFKTVRLQLLTYEPSYYSTLLLPLVMYYYLKIIVLKLPNPVLSFLLATIPLFLSLSFGVILGLLLALGITLLAGYRRFFNTRILFYVLLGGSILIVLLAVLLTVFSHNVFVVRFTNVLSGNDSSFRGRTVESFYLGWELAKMKSLWFGVGPGQVKALGYELFSNFYNYGGFKPEEIAIPNAMGDTLATFGIIGLSIRVGLQGYFFFRTRVYTNYYRLALFLFVFIYQFTGSFITNIAEYVIWVLAFHPGIFKEFDRAKFYKRPVVYGAKP